MHVPESVVLLDTAISTYWFDKDGILCSVSKPGHRTLEKTKQNFEALKKKLKNKKVYGIADTTNISTYDRDARNVLDNELGNIYLGLAILSKSLMGRMLAHIYMNFNSSSFPLKVFSSEKEARHWIKSIADLKKEKIEKIV
jgi:hypothetical protein